MRWGLIFICLLYCFPAYADEISKLKEQVATLQKQVSTIQRQLETLTGNESEQPIEGVRVEGEHRKPRASFKIKPGYNALALQANRTDGELRENTSGFGMSAEMDVRILKPLSFNLTFDGAMLNEKASLQMGRISPTQRFNTFSRTRLRLYTGSPNLRYRIFDSEKATADMSLGYGFVGYQVREHNLFSTSATFGTTSLVPTLSSDLFAHGPRLGIDTTFHPSKQLSFNAEAFYTALFDANWKVTGANRLHTEGYGARWDLGADYALTKRITVGAGWRGYFLHTDLAKTRINQTDNFFPETNTRSDLIYLSTGFSY